MSCGSACSMGASSSPAAAGRITVNASTTPQIARNMHPPTAASGSGGMVADVNLRRAKGLPDQGQPQGWHAAADDWTAAAPLRRSRPLRNHGMTAPDPASVHTAAFAFVQELARELNRGDLNLPSFPDSVVRIRKALDDPNCSPDKLARIATADQVLAGRLLKMANSALLQRGGGAVSELRTAIFKLGFAMVRNAAISVAMQ